MIHILVDSASDYDYKDKEGFYFLPLTVELGGNSYLDGINLEKDKFYDMLINTDEFPKTSQPSPAAFADVFEKVKKAGDELVCFTISSGLSGTYQSAVMAKTMVDYEGIYIVDSLSASHGIGLLVQLAVKLREEGASALEIAEKTEALKSRIKIVAAVDTLEYLHKGGRLSKAAATVGSLTGVKPIISVNAEGKVEAVAKVLGRGKALQYIIKRAEELKPDYEHPFYTIFSYGEENTEKLEEGLAAAGIKHTSREQVGSTIGAHVGPGAYGIIFIGE